MSLTSLLDRVVPHIPSGWNRTGTPSVLRLAQEGQDELIDSDHPSMVWIGTENKGFPPYLTTVAGTFRYDVVAANLTNVSSIVKSLGGLDRAVRCLRPNRVFVDTNGDYDGMKSFIGEPYARLFMNPYRYSNDRIIFAEIPTRRYPALDNTNAYIEFLKDPGSTTDIYFIEFTWEPPRLDSELIPLAIPARFEMALEDYILGKIELLSNGAYGERLTRFYNGFQAGSQWTPSWIEQYRAYMDGLAQPDNGSSLPLF